MSEFDLVLGIDWSGANPAQGVAVAAYAPGPRRATVLAPPGGRRWTRLEALNLLRRLAQGEERILAGLDFAFSWPLELLEFHAARKGIPPTAAALWRAVDVTCAAQPDLYAGAMVKDPDLSTRFWTKGKLAEQHGDFRDLFRETEEACRTARLGLPESVVKLIGSKQVGLASLSGMRLLHHLHTEGLANIWPFESTSTFRLTVAEIYPRVFASPWLPTSRKLKDAEEARDILNRLDIRLETNGTFGGDEGDALLSAIAMADAWATRAGEPHVTLPAIASQEGWILGVPPRPTTA